MRTLGLLFPGYGAQQVGMGKEFYDEYRVVQEVFEEAGNCTGMNFVKLCFASSDKELSKPLNAYLSLFVVQAALFEVLREQGVVPSLISGWGVGYVSAQYAAGVLTLPDGLYVLKKYVLFLTEMMQTRDIVVVRIRGAERTLIESLLQQPDIRRRAALAIVYQPGDYLVVGMRSAIDVLTGALSNYAYIQVAMQPFGYGGHALCVDEFFSRFNTYLEKVDFCKVRYPFVTPDGTVLAVGQQAGREMLTRFFYEPIEVGNVVRQLDRCDALVQIGSNKITQTVMTPHLADKQVYVFEHFKDIAKVKHAYDV